MQLATLANNPLYESLRRFQKCLRRAAEASSPGEASAAEQAARRIMAAHAINPLKVPDKSLYDRTSFADNPLLLKLRAEYRLANFPPPPDRAKPQKAFGLHDKERVRIMFNDGLGLSAIARKLGTRPNVINSIRAWSLKRGLWVRDAAGHFQLAARPSIRIRVKGDEGQGHYHSGPTPEREPA